MTQNHTIHFVFGTFIVFLAAFIAIHPAYSHTEQYDSVIAVPKEQVLAKRASRIMYRSGIRRFQKISDEAYIIPINNNSEIEELKNTGLFDIVEPDYKLVLDRLPKKRNYLNVKRYPNSENIKRADFTPNDLNLNYQYYLKQINATNAWETSVGNQLLVGVLDSGVDSSHPDLKGKVVKVSNEFGEEQTDNIGHGTSVAGIIAANTNNKRGIAGLAWNTKILPLKITDEDGKARVSTVINALEELHTSGAMIAQISSGTNEYSEALKLAIKKAQKRGILIISAGGNSGIRELRYPAAFEGVIGVGAIDSYNHIEPYSTTGEHITLVAPGTSIFTTTLGSSYDPVTGTSYSAPQVAGTAVLIWSVAPNLNCNEVREILTESAKDLGEPGKDPIFGYGLLNTRKAVEIAKLRAQSSN